MATCAASGMILEDDGWAVTGVDGVLCGWHADLADVSKRLVSETPDHWLIGQIAAAYAEPCPHPGPPPAPPAPPLPDDWPIPVPPIPLPSDEEESEEHEARLLRDLMPGLNDKK